MRLAVVPVCFAVLLALAHLMEASPGDPTARPRETATDLVIPGLVPDGHRDRVLESMSEQPPGSLGGIYQHLGSGPGGPEIQPSPPGQSDHTSFERRRSNSSEFRRYLADLHLTSLVPAANPLLESRVRRNLQRIQRNDKRGFQEALQRRAALAPLILRTFADAGLPLWLANIALVESHFNPLARSKGGQVGMWQLETATARSLGLRVGGGIDERLDPEKSTLAVVKLLNEHYRTFHDWDLVLAAYATGPMRVKQALQARPGSTVAELVDRRLLSPVILDQIARIHAASRVIEQPEVHGFWSVPIELDPELEAQLDDANDNQSDLEGDAALSETGS